MPEQKMFSRRDIIFLVKLQLLNIMLNSFMFHFCTHFRCITYKDNIVNRLNTMVYTVQCTHCTPLSLMCTASNVLFHTYRQCTSCLSNPTFYLQLTWRHIIRFLKFISFCLMFINLCPFYLLSLSRSLTFFLSLSDSLKKERKQSEKQT